MIDTLELGDEFRQSFIHFAVRPTDDLVASGAEPIGSLVVLDESAAGAVARVIDFHDEEGFGESEVRAEPIFNPDIKKERAADGVQGDLNGCFLSRNPTPPRADMMAPPVFAIVAINPLAAPASTERELLQLVVSLDILMMEGSQFSAAAGAILPRTVAANPLLQGVRQAGPAAAGAEWQCFLIEPAVVSFEIPVLILGDRFATTAGTRRGWKDGGPGMMIEDEAVLGLGDTFAAAAGAKGKLSTKIPRSLNASLMPADEGLPPRRATYTLTNYKLTAATSAYW